MGEVHRGRARRRTLPPRAPTLSLVTSQGERVAVLIPVKAFSVAKGRLAGALSPSERVELARSMAGAVVAAAAPRPVHVVCDDKEVADWAVTVGAAVIWKPGRGLNAAVSEGVAELGETGFDRVIVAHADLPHALGFDVVVPGLDGTPEGTTAPVVLVPDRHDDGTNVISLPTATGFHFEYGPGSCARHRAEAQRLGLPVVVVRDARLGWDVDRPADLEPPDWSMQP
ncbi:MAG: 2-phospho-L-lactate guanylyltransferase [Actinobacteria bacterium]|nr:2-phospho-L-lactate guanylyltransferase [Actinomycetota bacterium]